jgi:type I restriction enzyme S subunit
MSFSQGPRSLERVCDFITDGSHFSPTPQAEGFPIVNAKDIPNGRINLDSCTKISRIDWETLKKQNCAPIPADVLLSKDGTIGRVIVYESDLGVVVLSSIAILRPNNSIDSNYLAQVLRSDDFRRQLLVLESGSALRRIVLRDIKRLEFCFPEQKSEQITIATILSTVDRAIEQTESLIAKQQLIKRGMMQSLLSCGIDEHGKIRSEHTHAFRDSPLGRIPTQWDVKRIEQIARVSYGISDAIDPNNSTGTPTITLPCVSPDGDLILCPEKLAFTPTKAVKERDILQNGDLLFNWRNGSQNHLGKTAYYDHVGIFTHVGFLLKIRTFEAECDSRFLWFAINDIKSKGYFLTAKIQVNNTFNSSELRAVCLRIPPLPEQKIIRKHLDAMEKEKNDLNLRLFKLKSLKTALMQDLLTGNRLVTPLLDAELTQRAGTI